MKDTLLSDKQIRRYSSKIELESIQIEATKIWLKLMNEHALDDEKAAYLHFADYILQNLIGLKKNNTEDGRKKFFIHHEKCRQEFLIKNDKEEVVVGIEVKGMAHSNLFSPRTKGELSPVEQSLRYMKKNKKQYGICSNYDTFLLLTKNEYYKFCFRDIIVSDDNNQDIKIDLEKLKDFVYIFSTCLFPENTTVGIEKLIESAIEEEQNITSEFYDVYHKTRVAIILSFTRCNLLNPVDDAQRFLDQILFIMFTEDKGILEERRIFHDVITKSLETNTLFSTDSRIIFDIIRNIIKKYNDGLGSKGNEFKGFNGELFGNIINNDAFFTDIISEDDELKKYMANVKYSSNNNMLKLTSKISNINSIIHNLAILDSYDFMSEGSVKMLGHVFEQSTSDLETLHNTIKMKRKDTGVYYTSSMMTDYISHMTIIGYLSKTGQATTPKELLHEYLHKRNFIKDVEELEKKIKNIKILDPACGSGAFLINAADVLVEIRKEIQMQLNERGITLEKHFDSKEFRKIIKNHIFGVDINEQAVEIAKLSIFFKIVEKKALPSLSSQFVAGDSLLAPDYKGSCANMIDWNTVFSKQSPQFDVIIGNPPWDKMKPTEDDFFGPLYEKEENESYHTLSSAKKSAFIVEKKKEGWDDKFSKWYKERQDRIDYALGSHNYNHIQSVKKANGKSSSGDLNTYQLFIEKSMHVLKPGGYFGMVLPTALFLDEGSIGLRKMLLEDARIKEIFDFKNQYKDQKKTFADVDSRYRFCILIFRKNSEYEIGTNKLRRHILSKYVEIEKAIGTLDAEIQKEKYKKEVSDLKQMEEKNSLILEIVRKIEFLEKSISEDNTELVGYRTEKSTIVKNLIGEKNTKRVIREIDEKIYEFESRLRKNTKILVKVKRSLASLQDKKPTEFEIDEKIKELIRKDYEISVCKCESNNIEEEKKNAYLFDSLCATFDNDYEIPIINKTMPEIMSMITQYPTLDEWEIIMADEIHMTKIKKAGQLRTKKGTGCVSLWKGETIHQFDNSFNKPILFAKKSYIKQYIHGARTIEKRTAYKEYRLIHRIQTNSTNERTMIATVVPPNTFLTNSIQYVIPDKNYVKMTYLCGMLNSIPIDYYFKTIINTNINQHHILSVPIRKYDPDNINHQKIVELSAELLCRNSNFIKYKNKIAKQFPEIKKAKKTLTIDERIECEAEINAYVIIDYGFTIDQCEEIFSKFTIDDGERSIKLGVLKERIREHIHRIQNMKNQTKKKKNN